MRVQRGVAREHGQLELEARGLLDVPARGHRGVQLAEPAGRLAADQHARGAAGMQERLACGLETDMNDASRWSRISRIVDPSPQWSEHVDARYARFCEVAG